MATGTEPAVSKETYDQLYIDYCHRGVEMREVADQLYELYNQTCDTTPPEIYAAILGLHERLEIALDSLNLDGKAVTDPKDFPEDLRGLREIPK